jgi:hypothetical protein
VLASCDGPKVSHGAVCSAFGKIFTAVVKDQGAYLDTWSSREGPSRISRQPRSMEIYSHVSEAQQRVAVDVLQQAIATESHASSDLGEPEWRKAATSGRSERESGSGGRTRTYDQAVNSRPLYH